MISSLYTALSGMNAQRAVMDVTSHNISNYATEGYHRQRAELSPAGTGAVAAVFAGSGKQLDGVEVTDITRMIDQLAEDRLGRELGSYAGASQLANELGQIENIFHEPSDDGLAAALDEFWAGWSDLAMNPTSTATRTQTLENAQTVIDVVHRAASDLDDLSVTARTGIAALAVDVNELAQRIADLNSAITGTTDGVNDLLDKRDMAIRELSELTGAVARPGDGDMVDISIGGRVLVAGTIVRTVDEDNGSLVWTSDNSVVAAPPSKVASLMTVIKDIVPKYLGKLDAMVQTLVDDVNGLHQTGYALDDTTGLSFFSSTSPYPPSDPPPAGWTAPPAGTTAKSFALSADVVDQPDRIAARGPTVDAGGATVPGGIADGGHALAIAALASSASGAGEAYRSMVTSIGVETRAATRREGVQSQAVTAAAQRAASTGGVSLDEEMANLVAAQRAYEASARVLTTVDELLGVLMRTGVVGR